MSTIAPPGWKTATQRVFETLGRPRCLAIIGLLLERPRSRRELATALGISADKLSNDLFKLRHSGLLEPYVISAYRLRNVELVNDTLFIKTAESFITIAAVPPAAEAKAR